jgi:hypothetical protein
LTSPLHATREFIASEDNEIFWKYVEALGSSLDGTTTDEGITR